MILGQEGYNQMYPSWSLEISDFLQVFSKCFTPVYPKHIKPGLFTYEIDTQLSLDGLYCKKHRGNNLSFTFLQRLLTSEEFWPRLVCNEPSAIWAL